MIKFADLRVTNTPSLDNVLEVMRSGKFINGPYNEKFAEQWAGECQAGKCVLTSSGTAAIEAVLRCIGMGASIDDKVVILPAFSFAATAFAAMSAGCAIAYVDVNERGLIRWDQVETLLNMYGPRVLTVVPVWLYGQACYTPQEIANYITVVDDACQAHGIVKHDPSEPAISCFSFYPSKNLGAMGDAGAVVFTNMNLLAKRVAAFINYGDPPGQKYTHDFPGTNMRCDHIQAAYLTAQYAYLAEGNAKRQEQAATYASCGIPSFAQDISSWHLYPILVDNPERFNAIMADYNIETGNHYPYVLPKIAPGVSKFGFPKATYLAQHVATLPIGPHLSLDDVRVVAANIHKIYERDNDGVWARKIMRGAK